MDHRITQCPRCGTSFRVTEAHLAVAAGAVRCGSCLHIFNAREHWAEETPAPAPTPASGHDEALDQQALDELVIDDDALFDDNTPLFPEDRVPAAGTRTPPAEQDRDQVIFNASDADFIPIDDDEPEQFTSSFTELNSWEQDAGARFGRVEDLDEELSASDEEWTQNLLRDDEPLFTDAPPAGESPSPSFSTPPFSAAPFSAAEAGAELADFGLVAGEPAPGRREPTFGTDADDAELFPQDVAESMEPFADTSWLPDDHTDALSDTAGQPADAAVERADEYTGHPLAATLRSGAEELDLNAEFLEIPAVRSTSAPPAAAIDAGGPDAAAPLQGSDQAQETIVTDESYSPGLYADDRRTRSDSVYNNPIHGNHAGNTDTIDSYTSDAAAGGFSATAPSDADADPLASLNRLGAEPLQIHQFAHEPRWPQVLWGLALVALLALLAGQYIYANFDALARGSARPWLAQACQLAGCALPPQSDTAQIRSGNLIVRSHPTRPGALMVDAIITNQAPFPQPYPQLQLQFSDLAGAPVAGRRFLPTEYLAGELSGAALMPVQQPVHIALELVDPGPHAVNYSLTVVPADPAAR